MEIQANREFGPAWEIFLNGISIACAHQRGDAEEFIAGSISCEELDRRNMKIEASWTR